MMFQVAVFAANHKAMQLAARVQLWRTVCELLNRDVQDVFDQAVPMVYYCRN